MSLELEANLSYIQILKNNTTLATKQLILFDHPKLVISPKEKEL
jgi:hypothetical protein